MIDLYYYLDGKYNFSEKDLKKEIINEKIPLHVEDFFRGLFSKIFSKNLFIISKPDLEIDIALGDFKKLEIVAEVKWKNLVRNKEIKKVERNLNKFKDCKKILVVLDKKVLEKKPEGIEVWDI